MSATPSDAYKESYEAALQAIQDAEQAVDDKYKQIGDASTTLCDINQIASQVNNITVVRNRGGEVIGYDYKYTSPNLPDTGAMSVDSNTDSGMYATGGGGQSGGGGAGRFRSSTYAGTVTDSQQTTDKMNGTGLVSGLISSAWAGVSTLAKLGKQAASTAADALDALGVNFGINYGPISVDVDGASAVRALFGVDDQGNTTMYLEEDVIGALAIQAKEDGFFDSGVEQVIELPTLISAPQYFVMPLTVSLYSGAIEWYNNVQTNSRHITVTISNNTSPVYVMCNYYTDSFGSVKFNVSFYSKATFVLTSVGHNSQDVPGTPQTVYPKTQTFNGYTYYTASAPYQANYSDVISINIPYSQNYTRSTQASNTSSTVAWEVARAVLDGVHRSSQVIPGVSDQTGATIPVDAITGADPHVVAQNLESQYPTIMGNPVQVVVMDDSCNEVIKKYYSVPISYSPTNLNISAPITGGLQVSPSFNPDVTIDLPDIDIDNYLDQIIKILGGSGAGRDVTTEPEPDEPSTPSTDIPTGDQEVIIPDTGSGDTPTVVPPTTDVSSMWHIYNPQPEALSGLGSWLWSSSIIDQIVRLFTNPMEAIMAVHAIYTTPDISSSAPIVVGNLTSTASAPTVTSQYKSLSCGSVWLTEYFGNVFDYEPYTSVSMYLPFIGIVPLSVADVMRSQISVSYIIDFYTGACVARISVERDGSGGVLYEYPGDCSVKYPVSGASYTGLVQSIVAAATTAVRTGMATQGAPGTGALGALMAGASFIGSGQKVSISHSGSFSGNHGAMGSKIPYLIISRPITEMADNFEYYDGLPANKQISLGSCEGYTKCKEVHLTSTGAYKSELDELERLLRTGIIL